MSFDPRGLFDYLSVIGSAILGSVVISLVTLLLGGVLEDGRGHAD